jgi:hypothetical protein
MEGEASAQEFRRRSLHFHAGFAAAVSRKFQVPLSAKPPKCLTIANVGNAALVVFLKLRLATPLEVGHDLFHDLWSHDLWSGSCEKIDFSYFSRFYF